ncbi:cell division protein Fic [Bacteroidia bacterium]|nr:cell division protein Fic [Bacteroidia bacterium]
MPLNFKPVYKITNSILKKLFEIDKIKEEVRSLPLTPKVLAGLRESSKLFSTHYSTVIEGNRLTSKEVKEVLVGHKSIKGRERDEKEVKGYYRALDAVAALSKNKTIKEKDIQILHGYVMGAPKAKATPYREGQNVIKELGSGRIVYMPPEAKDVPDLMKNFTFWLNENKEDTPVPVLAAIAHYQFVTIHPYYDGNGRTARILTTLVLHQNAYDLNGIYNLEEYYAKNLQDYYSAITIGPSHNYYEGRAEADITSWIEYFITGMLDTFRSLRKHLALQDKKEDKTEFIKNLDSRQKKALALFEESNFITSKDLEKLFKFSGRTARQLAQKWVKEGFLAVADSSKKSRKYKRVEF